MVMKGRCGTSEQSDLKREPPAGSVAFSPTSVLKFSAGWNKTKSVFPLRVSTRQCSWICIGAVWSAVPAVNQGPGAERPAGLGPEGPALPPGRVAQFPVEVGVNEAWVRVVLHQAVDLPLSCQEDVDVGLLEALHDGVLGVEVQVYLQPDKSSERQHQTPDSLNPAGHDLLPLWELRF